jgi:HTH-type transcriptional regulator/antitoxin HigA
MTDNRRPAQVRPPGHFLRQLLDKRGWSQQDVAEMLGRPPRLVSEIVSGKRAITPETAKGLGVVFGTGPEVWMNLESAHQLHLAPPPDPEVEKRVALFGSYPIRDMQKRGWLPHTASLSQLGTYLSEFLEVPAYVAKKTDYGRTTAQQAAWLARAIQLSAKLAVQAYHPNKHDVLVKSLRECVATPSHAARVPSILASAGIKFLIIEPLPGSKIDAACMWTDSNPVIAMTLRYDKHDIFWHALFHELDHIKHGEGRSEAIVDSDMMRNCSAGVDAERRANEAAAAVLVPPHELQRLMQDIQLSYSEAFILDFAKRLNVHPGILVGQLQHHERLPWSAFSRLKSRIREYLVPAAFTDGFGKPRFE